MKKQSSIFGITENTVTDSDGRIAVYHVRIPNSRKTYSYFSEDDRIAVKSAVFVFTQHSERYPLIGTVEEISYWFPRELPWPSERTRHIYGIFSGAVPREFLSTEGIEVDRKGIARRLTYNDLPHMTFPPNTKAIGKLLFSYDKLQSATIPEGVKSIGTYAFLGAVELFYVTIPASVTDIAPNAFASCISLWDWHISPQNPNYKYVDPYIISDNGTTLFRVADRDKVDLVIPQGVREINAAAFDYCYITNMVIPDGVSFIGPMAFSHCFHLREVILPSSLRVIEENAFAFCMNLRSITIPPGVERIGASAFTQCSELREVIVLGKDTLLNQSLFALADLDGLENDPIPLLLPEVPISRIPVKLKFNAVIGFVEMRKRQIKMTAEVESTYLKYLHIRGRHLEKWAQSNTGLRKLLIEEGIF